MQLNDAIKNRKSVRKFAKGKPNWKKIVKCIDAARHAPAAGGIYATKFILVSDAKKIKEIADTTQQDFCSTAHYLVVAVSNDKQLVRMYEEQGKRYTAQQAGAAIQNFLLEIVEQKLATTWIGHFYEEKVKRVLEIPKDLHVEAIFPIGKESKKETPISQKPELEDCIYFDTWKKTEMTDKPRVSIHNA